MVIYGAAWGLRVPPSSALLADNVESRELPIVMAFLELQKSLVYFDTALHSNKILIERIAKEGESRAGITGYLSAGRDASTKKLTDIDEVKFDPASYDLVIVGTPVWASTLSAPVRTYLTKLKERFNRIAFYCTCGGGKGTAFEEMEITHHLSSPLHRKAP
jgi:hypothetical protein